LARFDLVVVDIEMPRMSGLDVIRAIRRRRDERAKVPIVALTAYAMREHRERVAAAGANGLIAKPISSIEAFGEALTRHLPAVGDARPTPAPPAAAAGRPDAPHSAPDSAPVADLAVFDALCAAIGSDMRAELLEKVVADLQQARDDLARALSPLDLQPIKSASHILISVAGAVGATRLQACARTLNTAAHGDDHGDLPDGIGRCLAEIDAAVEFAQSRRAAG
jgi:CheY-like chemotaxis protein